MARKFIAAVADSSLFLREWLANPQRTGSVAPSSPQLGAAMARWLPRDPESYVLELGPGTGAVTDALLKQGLREDRLIAIEHNPTLAKRLQKKYPQAHIIAGDAWEMDTLLAGLPQPIPAVGAVMSSLPLLGASRRARKKNPRHSRTARPVGAIQLPYHQGPQPGRGRLPAHRLQDCLVEPATGARPRLSEVTPKSSAGFVF